jgi:hypothetical protein
VFDDIKNAFRDLLSGRVAPEDRRAFIRTMRESLALARVSVDEMRDSVAVTRRRLKHELVELETARRRKTLAEGINDTETVTIAARFEAQHVEKIAALEKKLEGGEAELAIAEREVAEMMEQLKAAQAGVGSGMRPGMVPPLQPDPLDESGALERELDSVSRAQKRAAIDAEADAKLAELKRKMGK